MILSPIMTTRSLFLKKKGSSARVREPADSRTANEKIETMRNTMLTP